MAPVATFMLSLQAASSLMMAYGGDEFVHPDNAVPVYLARSGYPRIIPSHHRRMILKKDEKADMQEKVTESSEIRNLHTLAAVTPRTA
ncbi:unnamed protein product [Trifolium pratense]|uniref:Uncharacterized protein n=1 Tax=Trifolium pratense TaxID=57577 RepID=A0ACB0LZW8_TRIPR|nr:unnamed protein product [Trifolium pratense]